MRSGTIGLAAALAMVFAVGCSQSGSDDPAIDSLAVDSLDADTIDTPINTVAPTDTVASIVPAVKRVDTVAVRRDTIRTVIHDTVRIRDTVNIGNAGTRRDGRSDSGVKAGTRRGRGTSGTGGSGGRR